MEHFLWGLAYLVVAYIVLRIFGRLLIRWIYIPLLKVCGNQGLKPTPWAFIIWELIMFTEYTNHTGYELFFSYWGLTSWMDVRQFSWVVLAMAALPVAVMFFKAKAAHFIPLLLANLLGVPFYLLSLLVGMPNTKKESWKEMEKELEAARQQNEVPNYKPPVDSSSNYRYGGEHQDGPVRATDSDDLPARGDPGPIGIQYGDPVDSGSSSQDAGTSTYQSEYRPFDSGDYSREYDSDYSPMD